MLLGLLGLLGATDLGRLRTRGLWTCATVAGGRETPAEVLAAADLVVEGPSGVAALLASIADELERPAGP